MFNAKLYIFKYNAKSYKGNNDILNIFTTLHQEIIRCNDTQNAEANGGAIGGDYSFDVSEK